MEGAHLRGVVGGDEIRSEEEMVSRMGSVLSEGKMGSAPWLIGLEFSEAMEKEGNVLIGRIKTFSPVIINNLSPV